MMPETLTAKAYFALSTEGRAEYRWQIKQLARHRITKARLRIAQSKSLLGRLKK